ncbi:MAG: AAA family ATPase [Defluviitaleaceae bacterium]|nr:AAA family ATPase [Defluviitaleaceae bacterium]
MKIIHKYRNIFGVILILAVLAAILMGAHFRNRQGPEFMEYAAFFSAVEEGQIAEVRLGDGPQISFTMVDDATVFTTNNPRRDDFKEFLLMQGVGVTELAASGDGFIQVGFTLALITIIAFVLYRKSANVKVKSGFNAVAVELEPNVKTCNFGDIAGNLEAKESVQDIVDYLREPEKYTRYGARMPRGILLHGKPGTGKTLMARAMAGEAGVPFYAVNGSDFVQMYVGVGAARVRELFKKAREAGGAVIFIDEIDALGKKRSDGLNGNDEREQTLNALLTEMQGFSDKTGIVVIAATNRPDTLDEALLRPGRFDRRVEIGLPDLPARKQILALHAQNKPISKKTDLDKLAVDTVFFSGAMLEGLLNDAAISAAKRGGEAIEPEDITTAYYTALAGSEKKDRSSIRQQERTVTAWHESGHALAATLLNPENRVTKVTIIPTTGGAGGFCVNIPPERMYWTKKELEQQIMVNLAGRCAEELRFGADGVTTGASNDIEKATQTALQYVAKFGMGEGILDRAVLKDDGFIVKECEKLAQRLYGETKALLKDKYQALEAIASRLLEKETLDGDEIRVIARC